MAKGEPYTPEQRKKAVDLAIEIGVDDALARFEQEEGRPIRRDTLRRWISLAGKADDISEGRAKAIEAHQQEFEMRRSVLKVRILDEMEALLDDMRKKFRHTVVDQKGYEHTINEAPEPSDRAKLATAFGIFFDKFQLATGGPTSNQTVQNPVLKALIDQQNGQNETAKAVLAEAAAGADA